MTFGTLKVGMTEREPKC